MAEKINGESLGTLLLSAAPLALAARFGRSFSLSYSLSSRSHRASFFIESFFLLRWRITPSVNELAGLAERFFFLLVIMNENDNRRFWGAEKVAATFLRRSSLGARVFLRPSFRALSRFSAQFYSVDFLRVYSRFKGITVMKKDCLRD